MKVIAARDLPVFFEAETSDRLDKDKVLRLVGPTSKGTLSDKLRMFAVLSLRADAGMAKILGEVEEALRTCHAGAELEAGLESIKHMRQVQNFTQAPAQVFRIICVCL
jgi:hypothetical protein